MVAARRAGEYSQAAGAVAQARLGFNKLASGIHIKSTLWPSRSPRGPLGIRL
jgi:hypothetical protein